MKLVLICIALCMSLSVQAEYEWTNGDAYTSTGKEVDLVYPHFEGNAVIFRTTDNLFYRYKWSEGSELVQMTENAKSLMSVLLAAVAAKKKVSIYYDSSSTSKYKPFKQLTIRG